MAELSWRHHALIQALLSRGPLSEGDFYSLFSEITGKNPAKHQDLFHGVLLKLNKELAYVRFELRGCRDQYDGKIYYGVVNNVPDEQSKLGTKYSVSQIAFYKAVIEAITQDATTQGCITNIEALNVHLDNQVQDGQSSEDGQPRIPSSFRSFSMSQKEKTLTDLIRDRWLCLTTDRKIGLGIRSFLDLRSWFRSSDYPACEVCNEPAVKAATCCNEGCTVRIHDYCLKKKYAQKNVARVCPGCGTEWPSLEFDDGEVEQEATSLEESQVTLCSAAARKRTRSCRAKAVDTTNSQTQVDSSAVPRKRRSDEPSAGTRRTRRSVLIN